MSAGGKIRQESFVYNLTEHCNLTCHGCDHAAPLLPPRFTPLDEFVADLDALSAVYETRQMRITGGEPLLHPQVVEFAEHARRRAVASHLVLVTNGLLLHRAPTRLLDLVDEIWLSLYPQVRLPWSLAQYEELAARHGAVLTPVTQDRFFVTLLNQPVTDPALVKAVFRECKMAGEWSCHTVHRGRYYKCSPAPFMGARLRGQGVAFDETVDGIPLHEPGLAARLRAYLADETPLASCTWCLGTSGPEVPHRVLNQEGLRAWRADDHRGAIEDTRRRLVVLPAGEAHSG